MFLYLKKIFYLLHILQSGNLNSDFFIDASENDASFKFRMSHIPK